jgi:cytochrome c553
MDGTRIGPVLFSKEGSGLTHSVLTRIVAFTAPVFLSLSVDATRAETLEEKASLCGACHGENGIPQERSAPIIWGQQEGYIYLQLRDYKRGTRANESMNAAVEGMERDDLLALAEYFSKKPWPNLQQPQASGAVAARAHQANTSVGCTGCHLDSYQGDSSVPRLAGQSKEYLDQTIADFRNHKRNNNPGMSSLMNAATPEDLTAITAYVAGL